ncbi:MAG: hypothetical protein QGH74_10520 [Candidatus Brocadiia bacterium]|jgi:hypothetical protein|nr:hypothetical protein [Candidatus Brocadiia bacterium]
MKALRKMMFVVALAGCLLCAPAGADHAVLKSGAVLVGKVEVFSDYVRVETEDGVLSIPLWRVKEVAVGGKVTLIKAAGPAGGRPDEPKVDETAATPGKPVARPKLQLSLTQRKRVFRVLVRAERRAGRRAERDYPLAGLTPGYTKKDLEALLAKRVVAQMRLVDGARSTVAKRYGLTAEDTAQVYKDGVRESWLR